MRINRGEPEGRCRRLMSALRWPLIRLAFLFVIIALLASAGLPTLLSKANHSKWEIAGAYSPNNLTSYDGTPVSSWSILFNHHSHTTFSDGEMSPQSLVEWSISYGFNAIAVTDHNTFKGAFEARNYAQQAYNTSFIVIPGVEYTNCRCHMNLIGIDTLDSELVLNPTDLQLKSIITEVHSKGGIAVLNHPQWSEENGYEQIPLEKAEELGVDFVEVVSSKCRIDMQTLIAIKHKKTTVGFITGDDTHEGKSKPCSWTLLNTSSFTEEGIMNELKAHRTNFVQQTLGVPIHAKEKSSSNAILFFWTSIGSFFQNYYSFSGLACSSGRLKLLWLEILSSITWIIICWLFAEVTWTISLKFAGSVASLKAKRSQYKGLSHPVSLDEFGDADDADPELDLLTNKN